MATNKKPNKHKPSINPLIKAKMEASFKQENLKAREAGVEYGILATKIATLMIAERYNLNGNLRTLVEELNECKKIIMEKKPIVDMIKMLQDKGYNTTLDRLVELDPSLSQYF